jgi:hypothetical protein
MGSVLGSHALQRYYLFFCYDPNTAALVRLRANEKGSKKERKR